MAGAGTKFETYDVALLVPAETPDFWSSNQNYQLNKLQSELDLATKAWLSMSDGQINLKFNIQTSEPTQNLLHCDYKTDWNLGRNLIQKTVGNLKNRMIVINPSSTCKESGYAILAGRLISVKAISATLISHEIGHNFGFKHSGLVSCDSNNFRILGDKCTVQQYADKTDVMGAALADDSSLLSKAQKSLVWSYPYLQQVKNGTYTVWNYGTKARPSLLKLLTNDGYVLIEFNDATNTGGYRKSEKDTSGIEIRAIGSSIGRKFTTSQESGIGTLALAKTFGFDQQGNCPDICGNDIRFHEGEQVNIPSSKYALKVIAVSDSNAKLIVTGKLK